MRADDKRLRAAGLLISVVALGGVIVWASRQDPPKLPSSESQFGALIGAVAVYGIATALRSERWRSLLRASGSDASRADCYALTLVGYMGNNVLPVRTGDAMRVYMMAPRAETTMRNVIGTLVAERVLDVLTLLTIYMLVAYVALRGIATPDARSIVLVVLGAAMLVAVVLLVARLPAARRRLRQVIDFVRPMLVATQRLVSRHGLLMVLLTIGIWGCEAATYLLTAAATGVAMSPLESFYVIGVVSIFILIPSGPGYVGTFDAAVVFALRAIGATGKATLGYLVTLRFVLVVPITVAGFVAMVTRYRTGLIRRKTRATSG